MRNSPGFWSFVRDGGVKGRVTSWFRWDGTYFDLRTCFLVAVPREHPRLTRPRPASICHRARLGSRGLGWPACKWQSETSHFCPLHLGQDTRTNIHTHTHLTILHPLCTYIQVYGCICIPMPQPCRLTLINRALSSPSRRWLRPCLEHRNPFACISAFRTLKTQNVRVAALYLAFC